MRLVGSPGQFRNDPLLRADIAMTGSAVLVLPRSLSRTQLILQNLGNNPMAVEIGCAQATVVLSGSAIGAFTIVNAGFGFKVPPIVELLGGGYGGNTANYPVGHPGYPVPQGGAAANAGGVQAQVVATLSAGAVNGFTTLNAGTQYQAAPYVWMRNADQDPFGCAIPVIGSKGLQLFAGSAPLILNGTACTTDPIAAIGSNGDVLLVRWMD